MSSTTPKPTIANMRKLVEAAGGTLEQDEGGRYCVWQCVAPDGFYWNASDGYHLVVTWMPGCTDSAKAKAEAIADVIERVGLGLRPMTAEELNDEGGDL